jgi:hypothetical protein
VSAECNTTSERTTRRHEPTAARRAPLVFVTVHLNTPPGKLTPYGLGLGNLGPGLQRVGQIPFDPVAHGQTPLQPSKHTRYKSDVLCQGTHTQSLDKVGVVDKRIPHALDGKSGAIGNQYQNIQTTVFSNIYKGSGIGLTQQANSKRITSKASITIRTMFAQSLQCARHLIRLQVRARPTLPFHRLQY